MHKMKQAKEQLNYTLDVTATGKEQEAPLEIEETKQQKWESIGSVWRILSQVNGEQGKRKF